MIVDMEKKLSRLDSIENFKKKMRFETMAALKLDPQIQYNDDKKMSFSSHSIEKLHPQDIYGLQTAMHANSISTSQRFIIVSIIRAV